MAVALPNDRLLVANKAPCSGTVCTDVARVAAGGASEAMELPPYGMQVATTAHPKGMDFSFDVNAMIDWSSLESSLEKVAQLDEGSMKENVMTGAP